MGRITPWEKRVVASVEIKNVQELYRQRIKVAIYAAITRAMRATRQDAEEFIRQFWAWKTGHYGRDVMKTVNMYRWMQDPWQIAVGAENTPYAGFVNKMRGVKWTNPSTIEGVQGIFIMRLWDWLRAHVKAAVLQVTNYTTFQKTVKITTTSKIAR